MLEISVSIVDILDVINDGIALILSLNVKDKIYEFIYWFDPNDNFLIECDKQFLVDNNIETIYEYSNFNGLVKFFEKNITNKEELFKKFKLI
jgi:hypothetical protein